LVVLSACELGAGEISRGRRFRLRRAFQLAGAQTVIMSLWSIPDTETVSVMTDFYRRLAAGAVKAQALHGSTLAQPQARRQSFGAAHP
jgi:CHAT domain-containing protein